MSGCSNGHPTKLTCGQRVYSVNMSTRSQRGHVWFKHGETLKMKCRQELNQTSKGFQPFSASWLLCFPAQTLRALIIKSGNPGSTSTTIGAGMAPMEDPGHFYAICDLREQGMAMRASEIFRPYQEFKVLKKHKTCSDEVIEYNHMWEYIIGYNRIYTMTHTD